MAFVGTPSNLGDPAATLASIIQGEAGGEGLVGMQAVGAVIANRASQNFEGYGSDVLSQALAPNQFQGQSANYSPQAYSVAQSVLNGTNPDPTGGATSYANPSASSASWAVNLNPSNSLQIGNHFFTDNQNGVPFTPSFSTSDAGPSSNPTTSSFDGGSGTGYQSDALGSPGGAGATSMGYPALSGPSDATATGGGTILGAGSDPNNPNLSAYGSLSASPQDAAPASSTTAAPVQGDLTQFQVAGVNAPAGAVTAPTGTAPQAQGGQGSNSGTPLDLTNAQQVGDQAAGTIASGATGAANTLSKSITGAEGNAAAAGTSWLGSIFSGATDLFVRFGLVAAGLVVLLGAFLFFFIDSREGK